ncbi:hypothetical protein LCGC14_0224340 [marine sediment metagenome]|uniref:Uncharacterized protein n=1 Tax=marine sediment metagenome TaxID=412755 RepID=A0A0F9WWU8_9ZZZZ
MSDDDTRIWIKVGNKHKTDLVYWYNRMCTPCSNSNWDGTCLYGKEEECLENLIKNIPIVFKIISEMFEKNGQHI